MKGLFLCIATLFLACSVGAQTVKMSLQEALAEGVSNRLEMKARQLEIQIAQGADAKLRAGWMPQVQGNVDVRYNTQLQKSVLPIGEFGIPGTPSDATKTVAFGVPFQSLVGIDVSQKIYDPARATDKRLNLAQIGVQGAFLEQDVLGVKAQIAAAYYNLLLEQENLQLAVAALDRRQTQFNTAAVRFQNGALLQDDLDRTALDLSSARLQQKQATQNVLLAQSQLAYRLQLPAGETITPADSLVGLLDRIQVRNAAANAIERPEITAEKLQRDINGLNAAREKMALRPQVSAYGNVSLLGLDDQFSTFNYVGLRVKAPLYDGRLARLNADEFRLRQQINDVNISRLEADIAWAVQSARVKVEQALENLQESQQNLATARQLLRTAQNRYDNGALVPADLKDSEYSLQEAENRYRSAVYQVLSADLEYRQATGDFNGF
ncbi:MAG: TolC family protein [Lewinellaceae bacterium]|nr:TolC family protein [Lewinellaceae bacterium]